MDHFEALDILEEMMDECDPRKRQSTADEERLAVDIVSEFVEEHTRQPYDIWQRSSTFVAGGSMPRLQEIQARVTEQEFQSLCKKIGEGMNIVVEAFREYYDYPTSVSDTAGISSGDETLANEIDKFVSGFKAVKSTYCGGCWTRVMSDPIRKFDQLPEALRNAISNRAAQKFLEHAEAVVEAMMNSNE